MAELDGVWNVERVGGALPPMYGVRKRIAGSRGETKAGNLPGLKFDVAGLSLHYRFPFVGLVDHLVRDGDVYRGRATYFGRELGRFVMRPVTTQGGSMGSDELKGQLVKHIDDGIAMEQNVLRMIDSMIETTEDDEVRQRLREHRLQTEQQSDRLMRRLEAHGATPSGIKEAGGVAGALMKSVVDMVRGEKAGRNARDGYATEHMEIASYQLLERVAQRAGDEETAEVARENRGEEEQMAAFYEANWDKLADLSLREQGIVA